MTKLAILADTHCGIRNASEIFLENAERFYSEIFFPYLLEHNIKQILHLGDYYDNRKVVNIKAINHNRHVFLNKLREYGITMDIIPGNHDCFWKNKNDLNSLKEFLGHYMNEVNIIEDPTVLKYGNLDIGLVPWINQENEDQMMEFIRTCKAPVLGGHFELEGFDLMKGRKSDHGMNMAPLKKFDLVMSGHYHTKSSQENIHYLGSQMEFTWSDAHDKKYFHILDTDTIELTAIHNPITLHQRLIYDDINKPYDYTKLPNLDKKFVKVIILNKYDAAAFDAFLDRINEYDIYGLKIAEKFDDYLGESVSDEDVSLEDTLDTLDSYVDAVITDLDRSRLKNNMRELYTIAQALEIQ
jgi:DNA repair exonuclease SbcCD nuclease subunit